MVDIGELMLAPNATAVVIMLRPVTVENEVAVSEAGWGVRTLAGFQRLARTTHAVSQGASEHLDLPLPLLLMRWVMGRYGVRGAEHI